MNASGEWRVHQLRVSNFRQLGDCTVTFGPEITLLTGRNGSGKTSVLEALAVMLSTVVSELGNESRNFNHGDVRRLFSHLDSVGEYATSEPQYPLVGELSATLAGRDASWERRISAVGGHTTAGSLEVRKGVREVGVKATGDQREPGYSPVTLPIICYYGVERLIAARRAHGEITASRRGAYSSALDPKSDLTGLTLFLEALDGQIQQADAFGDPVPEAAKRQFDAIDRACATVLEPVGWKRLRWNRAIKALTLSHEEHGTQPLDVLASGTKIAALLAIDIASRMARANPHLGSEELLTQTPGIVLVDEIDLHLHPSWQQRIIPAIRRAFPRVQFVVSTHSPQVIASVENSNVRVLDGDDVQIPRFGHGLRAEAVLRYVQGTELAPESEPRKKIDRYLELVFSDRGFSEEATSLREDIEAHVGGIEAIPEFIEADAYLSFHAMQD